MTAVLAALPIAAALGLLAARAPPALAATGALGAGLALAVTRFATPLPELIAAATGMLGVMAEVALILLGGLALNELLAATGTQARLGDWLLARVEAPERALLTVVLGAVPFVESVTGFGVGAIVGIALLRRIGLDPLPAAVCGLLGLVTVPWGSLGPGTLVAARLTGVDFQALGVASAALSGPVFVVAGTAALWIGLGGRAVRGAVLELALAAGTLWAGVWSVNAALGTPLAGVLGGLAALGVMIARARRSAARGAASLQKRDAIPYGVLVAGLLITRSLSTPDWPAGLGHALSSPATWLLATCAITAAAFPATARSGPRLAGQALRRWAPIALTTIAFLALGIVLAASGMSAALAAAGARLGAGYPALAPWLGALGGFLTGSNTGASAMFAASQAQTAAAIGYPVVTMVALQNVGASLAVMAAVPKAVLAAAVANAATGTASAPPPGASHATGGRTLTRVLAVDAAALALLSLLALALA